MKKKILSFIKEDLLSAMEKRGHCRHEGETHEFCGKCGKDLREISSYECRICALTGRSTVYKREGVPDFCKKCGAPRFTFIKRKKKPDANED